MKGEINMLMELVEMILSNPNIQEWNPADSSILSGFSQVELDVIFNTLTLNASDIIPMSDTWKPS